MAIAPVTAWGTTGMGDPYSALYGSHPTELDPHPSSHLTLKVKK